MIFSTAIGRINEKRFVALSNRPD